MAVIGDATSAEDFRGCQSLNAAAEYPDLDHQVRALIDDHRTWLLGVLSGLAAELGLQTEPAQSRNRTDGSLSRRSTYARRTAGRLPAPGQCGP
ncbi:hypothetical protein OOK36_52420 [Streptomyces sp. NBC_00365]|uniref:hypothetical protein n=1 Tax=Streptomyces sp. NBC_00365 TaxID=2975726 RepID=UPI00225BED03|nr:hypothetical protein [Streptomyces sp. NBC_00365]MCX5097142.1 hypothetical protein [Streptomyces sp. NBC_00365]